MGPAAPTDLETGRAAYERGSTPVWRTLKHMASEARYTAGFSARWTTAVARRPARTSSKTETINPTYVNSVLENPQARGKRTRYTAGHVVVCVSSTSSAVRS